jgi:hypothetical protein
MAECLKNIPQIMLSGGEYVEFQGRSLRLAREE